jgi:hypothetical protein
LEFINTQNDDTYNQGHEDWYYMEEYFYLGQMLLKTCVLNFNEVVNTQRTIVQRRGILDAEMYESLRSTQSHISRGVPANMICGAESRGKGQGQ